MSNNNGNAPNTAVAANELTPYRPRTREERAAKWLETKNQANRAKMMERRIEKEVREKAILATENERLREENDQLRRDKRELKEEKKEEIKKNRTFIDEIEDLKDDRKHYREELKNQRNENQEMYEIKNQAKEDKKEIEEKYEKLIKENNENLEKINKLQSTKNDHLGIIAKYKEDHSVLASDYRILKEKLEYYKNKDRNNGRDRWESRGSTEARKKFLKR